MVTDTIIYKSHIRDNYTNNVILNNDLTKKDMRILFLLFTKMGGYMVNEDIQLDDKRLRDPENFVSINIDSIAETLDMPKKKVKKAIKHLVEEGILEHGDSGTIKHGYRFTF